MSFSDTPPPKVKPAMPISHGDGFLFVSQQKLFICIMKNWNLDSAENLNMLIETWNVFCNILFWLIEN